MEKKGVCEIKDCKMDETGVCALHGVEVERRRSTEAQIAELKAIGGRMAESSEGMKGNQKWILGVLTVYSILILGSYAFTSSLWYFASQRNASADQRINSNAETVSALLQYSKNHEKTTDNIIRTMDNINNSLRIYFDKQTEFKYETKRKFDAWGDVIDEN